MTRQCRACNSPIIPSARERNPKQYCSERCRQRLIRSEGRYTKHAKRCAISYATCTECDTLFVVRRAERNSNTNLACTACRPDRHRQRTSQWKTDYQQQHGATWKPKRRLYTHTCTYCSAPFQARAGAKYCSRACNQQHTSDQTRHTDGKHYNRRQRQRQATTAPVDRTHIFERDRWTCHLCGKRINRRHRYPHPMSASIDHIIPLAQHGTHEPANVASAHLACNRAKGWRGQGGEQLALIG